MKENVKFDPLAVEGVAQVLLFDAKTRKLVQKVEGKNFLSRALTERILRVAQRYVFAHQHPTQWDTVAWERFSHAVDAQGFFHWMILTDSAMAEAPAAEKTVPGAVIGYSNRQTHTDTDLRRGIINRSESIHRPTQTRWVMDWATDRGNGTIQSVCWGNSTTGLAPLFDRLGVDAVFEWTSGFADVACCCYEGDYWILPVTRDVVRRLAAATGALLWTSGTLSPVGGAGSVPADVNYLAVRGDHILYVGNDNTLRRRLISTGATSASLGSVGNGSSCAMIGDILYVFDVAAFADHARATGSTLTIRRYNNATSTWLANLTIPNLPANVNTRNAFPLTGNIIRVGSGTSIANRAWYHDIDIGALTVTPLGVPSSPQQHLARDGRMKLWVPTQTTTYASTTMRPAQGMMFDVESMAGNYLLSRIRLAEAISKTTAHTLKVIYDFNYI